QATLKRSDRECVSLVRHFSAYSPRRTAHGHRWKNPSRIAIVSPTPRDGDSRTAGIGWPAGNSLPVISVAGEQDKFRRRSRRIIRRAMAFSVMAQCTQSGRRGDAADDEKSLARKVGDSAHEIRRSDAIDQSEVEQQEFLFDQTAGAERCPEACELQ